MDKQHLTVNLIKTQITDAKKTDFQDADFEGLYRFSAFHNVANIVGKALFELGLTQASDSGDSFFGEQFKAVMDHQKQQYDLERIKVCFEQGKIPYVALKGAVIKKLYPEPEMRTSCDIDILVKKEDMEKASVMLTNNLGAEYMTRSGHDVSFMTDGDVHIELHHTLCENNYPGSNVLSKAWEYTYGETFEKQFTNEFFVYYHYAHMAKHLVDGGFGVRLVSDLYLINKSMEYDQSKLDELLTEGGLKEFAKQVDKLSCVWFENDAHNEATKMLEQYIFESGIFGTLEHGVMVRTSKGGIKSGLFKRLFLPLDRLKGEYPMLEKRPYLYMWFSFVRIAKSGFSKTKKEIELINSVDKDKRENVSKMLDMLNMNID